MNRRHFLKIAFAVGVATALPVALTKALEDSLPMVYGDGIHDDTLGIQAALDGRPFLAVEDCVRVIAGTVHLTSGAYRVTDTIHLGRGPNTTMMGGSVIADAGMEEKHILSVGKEASSKQLTIMNMNFDRRYSSKEAAIRIAGPNYDALETNATGLNKLLQGGTP